VLCVPLVSQDYKRRIQRPRKRSSFCGDLSHQHLGTRCPSDMNCRWILHPWFTVHLRSEEKYASINGTLDGIERFVFTWHGIGRLTVRRICEPWPNCTAVAVCVVIWPFNLLHWEGRILEKGNVWRGLSEPGGESWQCLQLLSGYLRWLLPEMAGAR